MALAVVGCGGAQKKDAPAPSEGAPPVAVDAPELTPVEAPRDTFLWGRLRNPGQLATSALSAAGLPFDWRNLLTNEAPELLQFADPEAPVEVAMALNPNVRRKPLAIVSWGVPAERGVLDELGRLDIEADEGPDGVHLFELDDFSCAVGPSRGPTAARMVCSDDKGALDLLTPFALRGMPEQQLSDADVHLEVDAAPLQKAYGQQLGSLKLLSSVLVRQIQIDNPRFDRAVADAVFGFVDELIAVSQDIERMKVQLWDKGGDFELSATCAFQDSHSWSVELLKELGAAQAPPPDWFWSLPAQSSSAYFLQAIPQRRTQRFWDVLRDALDGYLESEGLAAGTRERIERWLQGAAIDETPVVGVAGPVTQTPQGTLQSAWYLTGNRLDAARYRKLFDELAVILASQDVRKLASTQGAAWLPKFKRSGTLPGHAGSVVYEWEAKGFWSSGIERLQSLGDHPSASQVQERSESVEGPEEGLFAIVPAGDRTWFAFALNREQLAQPFALMGQQATSRLDSVAGMKLLQGSPHFFGGFMKLESLLAPLASATSRLKSLRDWEQVSRALPHRGEVPITFEVRMNRGEKAELQVVERFPRQFVADLAAAMLQAAK